MSDNQSTPRELPVTDNREQNRFEVHLPDGDTALVQYVLQDGLIIFTHTEVPAAYKGQGIADHMAQVALDSARANNLQVVPMCSFMNGYIQRHKQYQDLVLKRRA